MNTPLLSWICYSISSYIGIGAVYAFILSSSSKMPPAGPWFICYCWPIRLLVDIVNLKDAILGWHDKKNAQTNSPPIPRKPTPPPAPPGTPAPPRYHGYKMSRI